MKIPTELGLLKVVGSIDFSSNQLSGMIPSELGELSGTMFNLCLHNNRLSASLPTQLGALTELQSLRLNHNQLSGNLPSEIGQLTKLGLFRLHDNRLTGTIPTEIGLWGSNTTEIEHEKLFNHTFGTILEV